MARREDLEAMAGRLYGSRRTAELGTRLAEIAHWLELVEQQPLDLLDEEPDANGR